MLRIMFVLAALLATSPSHAGRIETVKETVKNTCNKEVDDKTALDLVKKAFLSCTPGQDVDAGGCKIKCLKENSGAVVGG